MANYEQELENFKQQWNLSAYNLNEVARNVQALRFADSFLTGASPDNSPAGQYVKWFSRTLSIYFSTNTTPNEYGRYVSSFDAQAFYDSFKALVQAKYDTDAQENGEVQLQVGEVVTDDLKPAIQNAIANCKRNYKKPLPTLWQENLKQGYLALDTLKTITDNSYDALGNALDYAEDELDARLTNLVAAREAMQQLRESRSGVWGWLWKVIFNREQNRQEKEYLQDLNDKINELSGRYNIEAKVADLTGKTILGVEVKAATKARETQTTEPVVGIVVGKVNAMLAEPDFKKDFTNEVIEALPKNNTIEANMQKAIFTGMLESSFIDKIQQFNQKFDEQEVKTEEHIIAGAKEVFKKAYTAAKALGYNQAIERLTVAQLLTDKIMQKCSPVALESEAYAQFANGYVLKHADELLNDVETIHAESEDEFKDNAREITFQKAGKAYDDMNREKLEIIDANASVNEQIVPPVQKNAPSINAISIDKK